MRNLIICTLQHILGRCNRLEEEIPGDIEEDGEDSSASEYCPVAALMNLRVPQKCWELFD
jgi:hypothetical protein